MNLCSEKSAKRMANVGAAGGFGVGKKGGGSMATYSHVPGTQLPTRTVQQPAHVTLPELRTGPATAATLDGSTSTFCYHLSRLRLSS